MGAFLCQTADNGKPRIFACAMKVFNLAQSAYMTSEKELCSVTWALGKFWSFILGAKVLVRTDHKALEFLLICQHLSRRLNRWKLAIWIENIKDALSPVDYPASYKEVKALVVVALLKPPNADMQKLLQRLKRTQKLDESLRPIFEKFGRDEEVPGYELFGNL